MPVGEPFSISQLAHLDHVVSRVAVAFGEAQRNLIFVLFANPQDVNTSSVFPPPPPTQEPGSLAGPGGRGQQPRFPPERGAR